MSAKDSKQEEQHEVNERSSGKKRDYVNEPLSDDVPKNAENALEPEVLLAGEHELSEYDAMTKEEIVAELNTAKEEVAANFERFARAQAEMKNIQHTTKKDIENVRKYALKSFVQELVSVIDNLDRTMEAITGIELSEGVTSMLEGLELTHKSLLSTLEKFGVESINPVGELFNPEYHEAMSMVPSSDHKPNTVMQVLQKGYTLNQRLIRPAMVMVSKKD